MTKRCRPRSHIQKWLKLLFCNEAVHNVCFAAGVPMPSFILGEEHVRAGAVPVHTRFGPDWPGPRPGGAAQNPRLPGPVPSGLPVRAEPHALRWNEGGHGPNWDLDIKDVPPLPATFASELFLQWSIWIGVVIECVILDLREFAFHEELRGSFVSVLWYFMKYGIWRTKRQHTRGQHLWLRCDCVRAVEMKNRHMNFGFLGIKLNSGPLDCWESSREQRGVPRDQGEAVVEDLAVTLANIRLK